MTTLDQIPLDFFDPYPLLNPPLFDDLVFIVISDEDEMASAPDALGDLWEFYCNEVGEEFYEPENGNNQKNIKTKS